MKTAVGLVACVLGSVAPATAQDSSAVVAASAAVTNFDSQSELTVTGSAGYRFNRSFGIEIEITAVPTLKAPYPAGQVTIQSAASTIPGIAIFPGPTYTNQNGRAVFFTTNVRVEIPTGLARLTPYFVAGGGAATVRHTADLTFPIGILPATPIVGGVPGIRTVTQPVSTSSTDLALTIGGGLNVSITSHVSIDGDLRYFRLLATQDANAGRFGVGVRYRF
jgi:opacity protein-like surface antigen